MPRVSIHFTPPEQAPRPPDEVRILDLQGTLQPDGRRVRVALRLTPFTMRPDVELTVLDGAGAPLGSLSLVEVMHPETRITLHLKRPLPSEGEARLVAEVRYPVLPPEGKREVTPEAWQTRVVHRAEVPLSAPPAVG